MTTSRHKLSAQDAQFMAQAIKLAQRGLYTASPNPRVGCVLVQQGEVISEGWHQVAGQAHAEVAALNQAAEQGRSVKGATAYVSLEPCSFEGKTGACSQALIKAEVSRVVFGMEDPNPKVSGQGNQQLRDAGIVVDGPLLEDQARSLNPGFLSRMEQSRPYIRIKMAMSLDGRTAMASGESKWITGPAARQDGQRLRARSCAVISGIETVLRDQALLTVRAAELGLPNAEQIASRQPVRVVLDSQGRLPINAPLLQASGKVIWVTAQQASELELRKLERPEFESPELGELDHWQMANSQGQVDLRQLLQRLTDEQCNEVLVEAGATLAGRFVQMGLVDELILYMAPKLLGSSARPLLDLPINTMAGALSLYIDDVRAVGSDWRITAKPDLEG